MTFKAFIKLAINESTTGGIDAINEPRQVVTSLKALFWHFFCRGALLGFRLQIDPDPKPSSALLVLGGFVVVCLFAFMPALRLGLALLAVCPLWIYAFTPIDDPVMENRGYLALLGMAFLGAGVAAHHPYSVAAIATLYGWMTFRRTFCFSTRFSFAKRAFIEAPDNFRCHINIAMRVHEAGGSRRGSIQVYETALMKAGPGVSPRLRGVATANLGLLYIDEGLATGNGQWGERAGLLLDKAVTEFPGHVDVHFARAHFFCILGMYPQSVVELGICLKEQPQYCKALRRRAMCHALLGDYALAQQDLDAAEMVDGEPGRINFRPAEELNRPDVQAKRVFGAAVVEV